MKPLKFRYGSTETRAYGVKKIWICAGGVKKFGGPASLVGEINLIEVLYIKSERYGIQVRRCINIIKT